MKTTSDLAAEPGLRLRVAQLDAITLADQVAAASIPAPTGLEAARGDWFAGRLAEIGYGAANRDEVGNVWVRIPGMEEGPAVVCSAHLDTVFDDRDAIEVRRVDGLLRAPGISDDARGLAVVLTLAILLAEMDEAPRTPIVLLATVGEEGRGNLRGVRSYFQEERVRDTGAFISVDGAGIEQLVTGALGSHRFRVRLAGPGGHSWSDYGTPNPVHALAGVIGEAAHAAPRPGSGASLTFARVGGGTSINAIPEEAWADVDVRAESQSRLESLSESVRSTLATGARHHRGLDAVFEELGSRPAGRTDPGHPLVRAAMQATREVGAKPQLVTASTDANVPMALGIPSLTMGGGGRAGGLHSRDEWYSNTGGPDGVRRAWLTLARVAGLPYPEGV